jgi:hypothetical protein
MEWPSAWIEKMAFAKVLATTSSHRSEQAGQINRKGTPNAYKGYRVDSGHGDRLC